MPQYFVSLYLPEDFDPSTQTETQVEEIHALNREMDAAGVVKFAGGLFPPAHAKSLQYQGDGKLLIWRRQWSGRARVPSRAGRRARCGRFFSCRTRNKKAAKASKRIRQWK